VVEFYGHAPDRFQSVIHTWYVNPADKAADKAPDIPVHFTMVPPDSLSDNFNDFGVLVEKETVTFLSEQKRDLARSYASEIKQTIHNPAEPGSRLGISDR